MSPRPLFGVTIVLLLLGGCTSGTGTGSVTEPAPTSSAVASTATTSPLPTTSPPATQPPTTHPATGCTRNRCEVVNPASGATLAVQIVPADDPVATLVLIPGGLGTSRDFIGGGRNVDGLVEAGFTVVLVDLDGRGLSGGQEDYGGHIHQDGLAEVIRAAAAHPSVDPDKLGVASVSYGITTASGALARHPDLDALFLIDWEGPANRDDTGGCGGDQIGWLNREISCDDEGYWVEREPSTSMGAVPIPYLRLQSERDHVQPDNSHAVILVNAATEGISPWTRLNDLEPNTLYDPDSPPPMLAEGRDRDLMQLLEDAAIEMLGLHG